MREFKYFAGLACIAMLGGCSIQNPAAELTTASIAAPPTVKTNPGTRVTSDAAARVFVLAGLAADCSPISIPMITVSQAPTKGTITFVPVGETTVQFSLSGKCVGRRVPGVGVFYKATPGQTGPDVFTVAAHSGKRELATRTIPVEIAQ
jgi:hypothetical protein